MQQSMFSAMFGAMSNEHRLNVIANNLANVNTTGYKKDNLGFKDTFVRFAHDVIMEPIMNVRSEKLFPEPHHMARTRLSVALTDFTQGSMKQTNSPLDVAIAGEGFLKVRTDAGDYYTRNGHFQVRSDGVLVTEQGYRALGIGGEIALPPNAQVHINGAGEIYADGELVDQLQVVTVDRLSALEKLGHNLFSLRAGSQAAELPAPEAEVNQGYLETSNVNVVEEMVNMIETQRGFEAYQKIISSTDEVDRKAITRIGVYK